MVPSPHAAPTCRSASFRRLRPAAVAVALLCGFAPLAGPAAAQDGGLLFGDSQNRPEAATLVADMVFVDADGRLRAQGNVEVFYGTAHLTADSILYDPKTERLLIGGPITMIDADGAQILVAAQADLATDLTDGILTGARVVLDQRMQIAANEIARGAGRYTRMTQARASSCEVCPGSDVPLWEIRARSVVHDQIERQLYFEDAQFRVAGLPLLYWPNLRIPDPTVTRTRGFLLPELRSTSRIGTGIKLPYFIPIGDSRDLTLTPYVSSDWTRTLEARYREVFKTGAVEFEGAFSRDSLKPGSQRGYVFGAGQFLLPRDFKLTFGLQSVSDKEYLTDYGISDEDRLESGFAVTRTRRDEYFVGQYVHYHSLREDEPNDTLPTEVGDLTYLHRFNPRLIGGQGEFMIQSHGHYRESDSTADLNGDGISDGLDVARVSFGAGWQRNWRIDNGMVFAGMSELRADFYALSPDPDYPATVARVTPAVGAELRWPWVRGADTVKSASWTIEPVAMLAWSPRDDSSIPNEDSTLVSFDEGNLFALNRYPGADRYEAGMRANLGVSAYRYDPAGWTLGLAAGRVLREREYDQFSSSTGLSGTVSDWLVAAQFAAPRGLTMTNRILFDDTLDVSRNELRLAWQTPDYRFASSYLWLAADPEEDRIDPTSEWRLSGFWQFTDGWRTEVDTRYDIESGRAVRTDVGLQYANECVIVDVSLSRRHSYSTSVPATTGVDVSVVLNGFGAGSKTGKARHTCSG